MSGTYLDKIFDAEYSYIIEKTEIVELNQLADELSKSGDVHNWFVRFVDSSKGDRFGMNYRQDRPHHDPPGIYAYPLDWFVEETVSTENYYATDYDTCYVFMVDISNPSILKSSQAFKSPYPVNKVVNNIKNFDPHFSDDRKASILDRMDDGNWFHILTNDLNLNPTQIYKLLMSSGISGIYDRGLFMINPAEPYQLLLLDTKLVEKVKKVSVKQNPDYSSITRNMQGYNEIKDSRVLSFLNKHGKLDTHNISSYIDMISRRRRQGILDSKVGGITEGQYEMLVYKLIQKLVDDENVMDLLSSESRIQGIMSLDDLLHRLFMRSFGRPGIARRKVSYGRRLLTPYLMRLISKKTYSEKTLEGIINYVLEFTPDKAREFKSILDDEHPKLFNQVVRNRSQLSRK